jgi:hypothetical protein
MEQLKSLEREYDENEKRLAHPLDFADLQQLRERRQVILREARLLAKTLDLSEPQWFSLAV